MASKKRERMARGAHAAQAAKRSASALTDKSALQGNDGRHVLLTGATGFVGKVVLAELLRRADELGIAKIYVLVRGNQRLGPHARIYEEVLVSACFAGLPRSVFGKVHVFCGEMAKPDLALDAASKKTLCEHTTHIVHCAAAVDFDRPLAEAAQSNVRSSVQLLELARQMPRLGAMVVTSTAYVTPWRPGPLPEALAPLPRPCEEIWSDVCRGVDEKQLLAESGHPNTYTFTKCLAEHLLCERRGDVPLRIVRPSIISASWQRPFSGWIDSRAAFAGFVVTIGAGLLRAVDADQHTALDLVPVDVVADRLLGAAFDLPASAQGEVPIVHAVAGREHCAPIGRTCRQIVRFFAGRPLARRAKVTYLGPRNWQFVVHDWLWQQGPAALAQAFFRLRNEPKKAHRARRMASTLKTINDVFPYFTHHTFEFTRQAALPPDFNVDAYVERVCAGALSHLLHRNSRALPLIGPLARGPRLPWGRAKRAGAAPHSWRSFAQASVDRLWCERTFAGGTLNEPSFLRAFARCHDTPDQVLLMPIGIAEANRVCDLLMASRPDLALASVSRWAGLPAAGGPVPTPAVPSATALGRMLQQRRPTWVVPVVVASTSLPALATSPSLARRFGLRMPPPTAQRPHLHVVAQEPWRLEASAATAEAAQRLHAHLQAQLAATCLVEERAVQAFLQMHPEVGMDLPQLTAAIEQRGGVVVPGRSAAPQGLVDLDAERQARAQWQALFAPELLARYDDAFVLRAAFAAAPVPAGAGPQPEPRLHRLLDALAQPIAQEYELLLQAVGNLLAPGQRATARALLAEAHLPDGVSTLTALVALCAAGLLRREEEHDFHHETVVVRRLADDDALARAKAACRLTPHTAHKRVHTPSTAPAGAHAAVLH